jgi:hypothetical protein
VKSYARRNPGTFIAVAAVAGALAGRLTRSVASGAPDADSSTAEHPGTSDSPASARPAETPERAPMRPPTARIVPADRAGLDDYSAAPTTEPADGPDLLIDVSDDTSYGGRL